MTAGGRLGSVVVDAVPACQKILEVGRRAHCGFAGIGPLDPGRLDQIGWLSVSVSSASGLVILPANIFALAFPHAQAAHFSPSGKLLGTRVLGSSST